MAKSLSVALKWLYGLLGSTSHGTKDLGGVNSSHDPLLPVLGVLENVFGDQRKSVGEGPPNVHGKLLATSGVSRTSDGTPGLPRKQCCGFPAEGRSRPRALHGPRAYWEMQSFPTAPQVRCC